MGDRLGYSYLSFDDAALRNAARVDPIGFVERLGDRCTLDEVQLVPELFSALKLAVDRRREAGRFLLTGSANVLLLPELSDSLAGRLAIQRLHPLAQCELQRRESSFLTHAFSGDLDLRAGERLGPDWARRVAGGGFPDALARGRPARRSAWHRDYVETIVQRDVPDLARIRSLASVRKLIEVAAAHTASMLNMSRLAAPLQLTSPTIAGYMQLLGQVFLLEELPAWHSNRLKRLIKSPKLHLCDSGTAASLLSLGPEELWHDREMLGQLSETFVVQELRRLASWNDRPLHFYHYRDRDRSEIDLVIEDGPRRLLAIEVKAGATVRSEDFRAMRKLKDAVGSRFVSGLVMHDGEQVLSFGERMLAVPFRALWEC